ncbi:hypothetical protein HMI54_003197 [Coelomomyces lativittatus]|nr:hypothetical protein HMI56_007233 [Coelomomyces lativittatus]KAJ1513466.1 hypothetical protein HMI55_005547 [Coelomomyces lativittatus]KAJ1517971.1 hypothetical protein HMI54_003197 [Coelomomyces lativittatus]
MSTSSNSSTSSSIKSFLSGGFGGICLVVAGHPLDLIKVRLQTGHQYKGMLDCAKQTVAKEGIRGLYKGMATPMLGVTPVFSVCFWGYDVGKQLAGWFGGPSKEKNAPLSLTQIAFAGAFSAIPTTFLMTPMERIKCLLQVQTADTIKYHGPMDAAKHIVREQGMKGLFTGTSATLLRDGVGSIGYFVAYEGIKRALTPENASASDLSPFAVFMAGGMAGMVNWMLSIPMDVLKSRLQTAPPGTYSGLRDVFSKTVSKEGPKALFKGLGPAMTRAFPANAACFLGMEVSRKFLDMVI